MTYQRTNSANEGQQQATPLARQVRQLILGYNGELADEVQNCLHPKGIPVR